MRVAEDLRVATARIDRIAAGPPDVLRFGTLVRSAIVGAKEPARRLTELPSGTIDAMIGENGKTFGVDPALVRAVAETESGLDPLATSPAGARGLMQLMPSTAQSLGVVDIYDPGENIRAGVRYLRALLDRFGNVELAIAAYNAGPAAVLRFAGVPPFPETQAYVANVLSRYRRLSQSERAVLKVVTLR
jgi:soluble lytic murein transglycosylase-like protein